MNLFFLCADKMSLQEAVLHGQLSARELEGVLRDLHRDITLSPADEQQIKGKRPLTHHPRSLASHTDSSTRRARAVVRVRWCVCVYQTRLVPCGRLARQQCWLSISPCRSILPPWCAHPLCQVHFLVHLSEQPSFHTPHAHTHTTHNTHTQHTHTTHTTHNTQLCFKNR
jgi:hypothetical protein